MLFFRYLFDRRRVLLCGLILLAVIIFLMRLYGLGPSEAGYCAIIAATLAVVMSAPDFVRYYRSVRRLQAVKRSALQDCPQPLTPKAPSPRGSSPRATSSFAPGLRTLRARPPPGRRSLWTTTPSGSTR